MLVRLVEPSSIRLERALASVWLAYQPLVCWSQRRVVGYEVLARSEEPLLQQPEALFRLAATAGCTLRLGRRVRALAAVGLRALAPDCRLYLNLHPRELEDPELFDPAAPLAREPDRIVFELTEHNPRTSAGRVRRRVAALQQLGYRVAIDDLGAGHNGLSLLAALAPDVVKLDRSLVQNCAGDPRKRRILRSLCNVTRDFGLELVAEGVETTAELDALVDAGCDLFQGYLFGRPCRYEELR